MFRLLALILGMAGAVAASQAPEFTQQYMQNLKGGVERLEDVVARFDEDAARSDMNRQQALSFCAKDLRTPGSMSCLGRAEDVADYERYGAQLRELRAAGDWQRPIYLLADLDPVITESTMEIYKPAVPTTIIGGGYALAGFALVWGVAAMLFGMIGGLFGGRNNY